MINPSKSLIRYFHPSYILQAKIFIIFLSFVILLLKSIDFNSQLIGQSDLLVLMIFVGSELIFNYVQQVLCLRCAKSSPIHGPSSHNYLHWYPADKDDAHVLFDELRESVNLTMKSTLIMSNLRIQNLIQFLQKCEQELQTKNEVNSLNQLSLLSQGKSVLSITKRIDLFSSMSSYVDTQAGLTKTPVSPQT